VHSENIQIVSSYPY